MPSTNFAPSGTMSVIEAGACLTPRRPSQVPSLARSNNGRRRRGVAVGASARAARSASPTSLASRSMVGGVRPGRRMRPGAADDAAGARSPRNMRCSSAVASVSCPAWVNRVASRSVSWFSIVFTSFCRQERP